MKSNIKQSPQELIIDLFNYYKFESKVTNPKLEKLSFIDLFAGIGGIKIAFEEAGFECIFSNDFDKNCKITFDYNSEKKLHFGDISSIKTNELPSFDILTAGFPCQPFSIAGYRQGFNDEKGRGNVFFEIIRIIKDKKPSAFLLENVKNLKNHDQGQTIKIIYQEMQNIGYHLTDKIMNAMEYGDIPQNRERIYIVGFKDKKHFDKFIFPKKIPLTKKIENCLEEKVDQKYYYNNKPLYSRVCEHVTKKNTLYQWRRKYVRENKNSVCPTLTANMGMGGHNVPIIIDDYGIRKLTPRECANFQGFPANFKLPTINDSSLYKQFGNSVAVNVVKRIADNMLLALQN